MHVCLLDKHGANSGLDLPLSPRTRLVMNLPWAPCSCGKMNVLYSCKRIAWSGRGRDSQAGAQQQTVLHCTHKPLSLQYIHATGTLKSRWHHRHSMTLLFPRVREACRMAGHAARWCRSRLLQLRPPAHMTCSSQSMALPGIGHRDMLSVQSTREQAWTCCGSSHTAMPSTTVHVQFINFDV